MIKKAHKAGVQDLQSTHMTYKYMFFEYLNIVSNTGGDENGGGTSRNSKHNQ